MSQTTYPTDQIANPINVFSHDFISPAALDLVIVKKFLSFSNGDFKVTNVNGDVMFKVEGKFMSVRDRRVLHDAVGNPIMSFQKKMMSSHDRWVVFRGDSSNSKDITFSAKRSSYFQFKTSLNVFLAHDNKEKVFDFKVKGSWFDRSCTIFSRDGTTIIAQMHKKHTVKSVVLGKDKFAVTVYPNVDYAFIVALVVILHEINTPRGHSSTNSLNTHASCSNSNTTGC